MKGALMEILEILKEEAKAQRKEMELKTRHRYQYRRGYSRTIRIESNTLQAINYLQSSGKRHFLVEKTVFYLNSLPFKEEKLSVYLETIKGA
jgi:hypothetical protein